MLGRPQRQWLRAALKASRAPLKLVVSGSVALGNPQWQALPAQSGRPPYASWCGGDDLDCYAAAQRELLHLAASAQGCTLILTGDFHWTDIKVLTPANDPYGVASLPGGLPPGGLVQVMSSGLTAQTSPNRTCAEFDALGYTVDCCGLREEWGGGCSVLTGGSFATIHVGHREGELEYVEVALRDANGRARYTKKIDPVMCRAFT